MSMFGLKESEAATLVRMLTQTDLDRSAAREAVARSMWTGIVEPGDRTAGILVSALGAARALELVVEGRSADEVLGALAASGGALDEVEEEEVLLREIAKAIARWKPRLIPASALLALRSAERVGARLLTPPTRSLSPGGSFPPIQSRAPIPAVSPQESAELLPVSAPYRDRASTSECADSVLARWWPVGLNDLGFHAPLALWCRGSDDALGAMDESIALVGARAATGYGEHVTMEASAGLADRGYTIVSGAAYGIDGMAHRAALASHGNTVAILAGGVDRFYPSGHDALLTRIADVGVVISELPCGEPPTKWRFLQRNRLIAAVSRATVVIEAGWRSGSLNTAGHAASLARPLGAVPGPVTSAASAGCHRLIREFDAVCVTNADEMAELAPLGSGRITDPANRFDRFPREEGRARGGAVELAGLEVASTPGAADRAAEPAADTESDTDATNVGDVGNNGAGAGVTPRKPLALSDRPSLQLRVLDAMSARTPRPSLDIAARCGLAIATVQSTLGTLALEGKVAEREGGWVVT